MTRNAERAVRLIQIQQYIYKNPLGLTTHELARRCGVAVRTVQRDMLTLQSELHVPIIKKAHDRYGLPHGYFLPPIILSLYEAIGLFLAARLMIRQTDERNPHIESALKHLCSILPQPVAEHLEQAVCHFSKRMPRPDYLNIFEQVAQAWSNRRRLKFNYRSLRSSEYKQWIIEPYFIEMTGTGYSVYMLGNVVSGDREGIITFKLDRMSKAQVLEESFDMPAGLGLDELLKSSWGIMWGDEVEVSLKFSPQVSRRVKESVWHSSQVIEDTPDGGCLLTMRVGSTLEIMPWIRGWGLDVEVLEPKALRDEFRSFARRLYAMYYPQEDKVK